MNQIDVLRFVSRKLIRELGLLQLNQTKSGRTPQLWHALIEIAREPEITISNLGKLLLLSTSATSRIVDALLAHGLISTKDGVDRREKKLEITPKGQQEVNNIDEFSKAKIVGAFEFLNPREQKQIIEAITKYAQALEQSRLLREQVKIRTISTARTLRKQIVHMIENIQVHEFAVPITADINSGVLRAEEEYHYNNAYNFWYATDHAGAIIGCVGLKKIDAHHAEVKKFFVEKKYRRRGVAQKLMVTLLKAAIKHGFENLYLGTVDRLKAAQRFYEKYGFVRIVQKDLPNKFDVCPVDNVFFHANTHDVIQKIMPALD